VAPVGRHSLPVSLSTPKAGATPKAAFNVMGVGVFALCKKAADT